MTLGDSGRKFLIMGLAASVAMPAFAQPAETQPETPQAMEERARELIEEAEELRRQAEAARIAEAQRAIEREQEAIATANQAREFLAAQGVATGSTGQSQSDKPSPPLGPNGIETNFGGIEFGVGLAYTLDAFNSDRVEEADIFNNVVRVTRRNNARARLILESHYFFTPCGDFLGLEFLNLHNACDFVEDTSVRTAAGQPRPVRRVLSGEPRWGVGPFIALQPAENQVIDAVGMGLMVGFRRSTDRGNSDSFNLGLGLMVDINSQILGEGFVEGQAPPPGETEIRFSREAETGLLIMSSYSF